MDVQENEGPSTLKGAAKVFARWWLELSWQIEGVPGFITTTHRDECSLCEQYAEHAVVALEKLTVEIVIETGEVIYITITDHSKTTRSIAHRHTTTCACWIQQYMVYTLPPNAPQAERTTRSTIKTHTSSSRTHICTLLDRIDTTLLYHLIPNGITPHW